jgi:hypothetical protein
MAQCARIKADGNRCKLPARGSNGLCYFHDPAMAGRRKRQATRAGKAGGRGRPQGEVAQIKDKLRKIAKDVLDPKSNVGRGDAAVAIQAYAQIMNCIRTELKQREQEDLVERLESLESALAARKQGYGYGA